MRVNARPEQSIAVVGHSAFIKMLTGMRRKLKNCEVKRFLFAPKSASEQNGDIVVCALP